MTNKQGKAVGTPALNQDRKKYRDRPADEGKHGDAAEEPNSGVPTSAQDAPGRPTSASSRQQTRVGQITQTGSPELDSQQSRRARPPKRG
jgi:hypothetical protein